MTSSQSIQSTGSPERRLFWIGWQKHLSRAFQEGARPEALSANQRRWEAGFAEAERRASARRGQPPAERRGAWPAGVARGLGGRAYAVGGASTAGGRAGCGRRRRCGGPGDGRSPSRWCWWPPPPLAEPSRLFPRVAASPGGGMLGKGGVGGGGGTRAPKPSFVSYVRPEVRRRGAGWGEGRLGEPPAPPRGGPRGVSCSGTGAGGALRGAASAARWGLPAGRQVPRGRARPVRGRVRGLRWEGAGGSPTWGYKCGWVR